MAETTSRRVSQRPMGHMRVVAGRTIMKKMLLLCAGLLLAAGITSAEVVSTNIVGYLKKTAVAPYYLTGSTFVKVQSCLEQDPATDYKIKLSDIKIEGMTVGTEFIQILDEANATVSKRLTYIGGAPYPEQFWGWWEVNSYGAPNTCYDDYEFSPSSGFLCNFTSGNVINMTYAGEVLTGETEIDLIGQKYPVLVNFLPVDLTLKDLKVEGMAVGTEFIQILDEANATVSKRLTYIGGAPYPEPFWGWWEVNSYGAPNTCYDDEPFPSGSAFLCNFTVSSAVKVTFPDPMLPLAP